MSEGATYDSFLKELRELCSTYEKYKQTYRSTSYDEMSLRIEYLDKFFRALGWDVNNSKGVAPHLREVVLENRTLIDRRVKRADYVFYIGGMPKFVVEAKSPREHVEKAAYQVQNYAFNLRLYVGIATNFEDFRFYVIPGKPEKGTPYKPTLSLYYKEYESSSRKIWDIFARENVEKGSIEQYLQNLQKVSGRTAKQLWLIKPDRTKTVDNEFLSYLEKERASLARYLVQDNPGQSWGEHGLNEAVQRIIDRVLFQRVCEDRDIDTFNRLPQTLGAWREGGSKKGQLWPLLVSNFRSMARTFNGGLYGKVGEPPHFTDDLNVRDSWLANIIDELSAEDSPYLFSTLPVEILGSVYERFLGSVVLPNGKVEQKPEVRKSGGVYYTPQFVVDDIIQKTIDPLILGKKPEQVRNIRILDPSCGSGSFLIRAFDRLCEYHVEWLMANPSDQNKNNCYVDPATKEFRLTVDYKKKILLNCIYGIDVDEQAVEVTQLSLYLKLLEGETRETLKTQLELFSNDTLLPDLKNNIRVANSLMDEDCIALLADEHDVTELKPLQRTGAFSSVENGGGFHAIIGNPPYDVLEKDRNMSSWPHDIFRDYVRKSGKYEAAFGGKLNLFRFFIVRSLSMLKANGRFGMIIPLSLLGDISCAGTRKHVLASCSDIQMDCFPQKDDANRRIFFEAKLSTCILTSARSSKKADGLLLRVFPFNSFNDKAKIAKVNVKQLKLLDPKYLPIPLMDAEDWEVVEKLHTQPGIIALGKSRHYKITRGEINQTIYRAYITDNPKHARLLKGVEVGPYKINKRLSQGKVEWFNEKSYNANNAKKVIVSQRRIATQRITGVDERRRIVATIMEPPAYFADSTNSIALAPKASESLEYLLGFLNSSVYQWRFRVTSTNNNVGTNELKVMPIKQIDQANAAEVALHDKIVNAVRQLLSAETKASAAASVADQMRYSAIADTLKTQIDECVETLFGVSTLKRKPWNEWTPPTGRKRGRRSATVPVEDASGMETSDE